MFAIPPLQDLVARARAAFNANLKGADARLWPNNVYVAAKVIGGAVSELFGFADYTAKQKFALTADAENLDRHGEELGLARRPTAPARGQVTLTASGAITVAPGAVFQRSDGALYNGISSGALLGAGTLSIDVVAAVDGKDGNAEADTSLEIVSGVTGAATAAVGDNGIAGGVEIEDDESFRARILFRKRNPPHGGSAADYVMWSESVSGVTRVFVERLWNGPGTVRVFPLMDDLYADGIPASGDVLRVQDYLDAVKPAGAGLTVAAPTAHVVDITISGLTPNTADVKAAVVNELTAAFRRLSRVAGVDTENDSMPYLAWPTTFSRSWIWQAIANATGEERHVVTAPSADVSLATGEIATLGAVTFS
jgi:uncharacterized phage protein gp47/JayE